MVGPAAVPPADDDASDATEADSIVPVETGAGLSAAGAAGGVGPVGTLAGPLAGLLAQPASRAATKNAGRGLMRCVMQAACPLVPRIALP